MIYLNKRQHKKLDKRLTVAIQELNNDVAISEGFNLITDSEVIEMLNKIKKSKSSINRTLNDYKQFILN